MAKFGSSKERATPLKDYAHRRVLPYGKTVKTAEEQVAKHIKEIKKEWRKKNASTQFRIRFCSIIDKPK